VSANAIVVTATASTAKEAEAIADVLVRRRLAACVQLSQIRSKYIWQGKVAFHDETLLTIKTLETAFPKLQAAVMEASSYDVPEILAQPVTGCSKAYFDWIVSQVDPA